MSTRTDRDYLLATQYRDAGNLNARIELHRRFSANPQGLMRWLFERISLPAKCRVLEVGCGPGSLWQENLERVPNGLDVVLTDFSEGMVSQARSNLRGSDLSFHFMVADAQQIPFADESFDVVIANHMLYHVPDLPGALSEMRRALRPGGRFYAATLGRTHMREVDDLVERFTTGGRVLADSTGDALVEGFCLENGAESLAPWFSEVSLHRYEDALLVTEAAPLVAYVLSIRSGPSLLAGREDDFTRFVERELSERGAIYISKDPGLFEARRP